MLRIHRPNAVLISLRVPELRIQRFLALDLEVHKTVVLKKRNRINELMKLGKIIGIILIRVGCRSYGEADERIMDDAFVYPRRTMKSVHVLETLSILAKFWREPDVRWIDNESLSSILDAGPLYVGHLICSR